ncbi:MAG: LysR family transcriptional regulator [Gammaproteobacteria bacterium]|nr:LysR family transcriptional regulator [Gammaproteobacteria bacterium]MBU2428106.1 LysR family transcriptional regulator [Gammaproteobacteria bacterium]
MNYPSPRHWLLLDAICRWQSLSKAADKLALSQPAASQALKELEQRLGYPLFLRQNRQLLPTQAALDLLPKLQQLLQLQQELVDPASTRGELRLVASETIGCYLLPALLAEFTAKHPDISFQLQICNSSDVQTQLRQQQAQLGFIEGPVLTSEFSVQYWLQDQLVLVGSPRFHADIAGSQDDTQEAGKQSTARSAKRSAERLQRQPWIIRERGSGTRAVLEHELARLGWTPAKVLELQRPEAIKQAVKQGLGIGCLPELAVQDELAAGQLMLLPSPLQLQRHLSLVVPVGYQSPLLQTFVRFLQQIAKQKN